MHGVCAKCGSNNNNISNCNQTEKAEKFNTGETSLSVKMFLLLSIIRSELLEIKSYFKAGERERNKERRGKMMMMIIMQLFLQG